jgi:hypothetical protein
MSAEHDRWSTGGEQADSRPGGPRPRKAAAPLHALAEGPVPDTAWQLVHNELMLDGMSRLNLAAFVTTWLNRRPAY